MIDISIFALRVEIGGYFKKGIRGMTIRIWRGGEEEATLEREWIRERWMWMKYSGYVRRGVLEWIGYENGRDRLLYHLNGYIFVIFKSRKRLFCCALKERNGCFETRKEGKLKYLSKRIEFKKRMMNYSNVIS